MPVTRIPARVIARLGMIALLLMVAAAPAAAQDFRAGYNAYQRGDYATAFREWEPLAQQGYKQAQTNLGTLYSHAKGVERDYGKAVYWYRKAAAQGSVRAMYNLGVAYEYGRGVNWNDKTALLWYRQAAQQGVVEAMNAMAWIYATSPDANARDGRQAIRLAQSALNQHEVSKYLGTLAAAYAETGAYDKAIATIERAIESLDRALHGSSAVRTQHDLFLLIRTQGRTDEAFALLEHLEFYRSGQPVRD